jgi:type IV pilus assembly protein PilE
MRSRGFTLLELMIACAIVAILAAIAYPSYVNSVQKSRRSEATAALLGVASQMERYNTEKGTYATATLGTGASFPTRPRTAITTCRSRT